MIPSFIENVWTQIDLKMLDKDNLLPIIRSETWMSKMVTALLVNVLDCVNRWLVQTYGLLVSHT